MSSGVLGGVRAAGDCWLVSDWSCWFRVFLFLVFCLLTGASAGGGVIFAEVTVAATWGSNDGVSSEAE